MLKPLKTNTIGAKDVEKISKKCLVIRIHGRDLPEKERFLLFEMRRLLLEDQVRTSRTRGGGIYHTREPIKRGEAVYTIRVSQSNEGRRYIPYA